jgi:hypothetical protein
MKSMDDEFQATFSASVCFASQLIKPSPFASLWSGSASGDYLL